MNTDNLWLFTHLLEWMRRNNISQTKIEDFIEKWSVIKQHQPFPCPSCFANNKEGVLLPLSAHDGIEPVECNKCKMVYEIPLP